MPCQPETWWHYSPSLHSCMRRCTCRARDVTSLHLYLCLKCPCIATGENKYPTFIEMTIGVMHICTCDTHVFLKTISNRMKIFIKLLIGSNRSFVRMPQMHIPMHIHFVIPEALEKSEKKHISWSEHTYFQRLSFWFPTVGTYKQCEGLWLY
jgi:hypothetical protein